MVPTTAVTMSALRAMRPEHATLKKDFMG